MQIKKLVLIIIGCLLVCTGCIKIREQQAKQNIAKQHTCKPVCQPVLIKQHYVVPYFNKVVINGNFNVKLVQGKPDLTLVGNDIDIAKCKVAVAKHTLYLLMPLKKKYGRVVEGRIKVYLYVNNLRSLTVSGQTYLVSNKNCTRCLKILATDNASVTMTGELNMHSIVQQGHGKIELRWVKSKNLSINARNDGPIYVAGAADELFVKLNDHANLKARYLRAQAAVVLATRNSQGEVLVVDNLNSYADATSNIYYYKRPKHYNAVTLEEGNSLHAANMR